MSNEDDRQTKQRDANERETAKLWRVWRTIHEMVQDRGYELSEAEVKISLEEFKAKFRAADGTFERANMRFSARPTQKMLKQYTPAPTARNPDPSPETGMIWVEFCTEIKPGVKHLRDFAHQLAAGNFHTGVYVLQYTISPAALKIIPAVAAETKIETFFETDLLVNITHHELVPTHVLLSGEERAKLLERYRLKDTQLPRIQSSDPIARYYGLKRGQVVKIIRKSETAGRYASYRLCV